MPALLHLRFRHGRHRLAMRTMIVPIVFLSVSAAVADEWMPQREMVGTFIQNVQNPVMSLRVEKDGTAEFRLNYDDGTWSGRLEPENGGSILFSGAYRPPDPNDPERRPPEWKRLSLSPEQENRLVAAVLSGAIPQEDKAFYRFVEKNFSDMFDEAFLALHAARRHYFVKQDDICMSLEFDPKIPAFLVTAAGNGRDSVRPLHLHEDLDGFSRRTTEFFQSRLVLDAPFSPETTPSDAENRLAGVWENAEDGFGHSNILLSTNRFGLFAGGVSGMPVKWSAVERGGRWFAVLETIGPDDGKHGKGVCLFLADLRRETLLELAAADTVDNAFAAMRNPETIEGEGRFRRISENLSEDWEKRLSRVPVEGAGRAIREPQ